MELEQGDAVVEDGVEEAITDSTTDSTDDNGQDRQPETPKVNLDEIEEFKQFKANANRQFEGQRQAALAAQAEAARLKAEADNAKMQQMSDEDKLRYQLEQAQAELSATRHTSQRELVETQRQMQLKEITDATGVPLADIESAQTPMEAWKIANAYQKANAADAKAIADKEDPPTVDVGGRRNKPRQTREKRVASALKGGTMADLYAAHTQQ